MSKDPMPMSKATLYLQRCSNADHFGHGPTSAAPQLPIQFKTFSSRGDPKPQAASHALCLALHTVVLMPDVTPKKPGIIEIHPPPGITMGQWRMSLKRIIFQWIGGFVLS